MAGGHDRLTPEGRQFFAEMEKLRSKRVFIGFQAGKVIDDRGVDMAQIAMFNELGTSIAPARPFLRQTVDENLDDIKAFGGEKIQDIAEGGTAEGVLKQLGVYGKGLVQEQIKNGTFKPNAPSTVRRKKSDKPLIDTGKMRQSVNFVIKKKGEG